METGNCKSEICHNKKQHPPKGMIDYDFFHRTSSAITNVLAGNMA